jgi:hypothetical protein
MVQREFRVKAGFHTVDDPNHNRKRNKSADKDIEWIFQDLRGLMPVDQKQAACCSLSVHTSSAFQLSKFRTLACDKEVEAHKDTSQHTQPDPHFAKAPDLGGEVR